ncbi:HypC/HybG/HupF family hydrogenase formation chaperone [Candidatus Symbiobacter mobilis]|uniref:Hydrogenase maturation protein HypC n=1 Tax=Candidatus Symbiobacter mobilis CR TaxID=946483 RepID=U5N989_9BURK|nr:HypC/HybG/HupF family hydrogenase formation chaperone [Candidatus Symbiobacter mobilis]AGX86764.1 hydrogenase maturation protein HypC [Candidatus Symbiobacter mobilis CR]
MCLAFPVRVVEMGLGPLGDMARVECAGVEKEVSVALLDEVSIGDYVILHAGYALSRLDPEEARTTLEMFAQMSDSQ